MGKYYTKMKNFIDFLSLVSTKSKCYQLIVPCREASCEEVDGLIPIDLPATVQEVSYYEGHVSALIKTFINVLRLRRIIKVTAERSERLIVAGPGPNSMLFLLSLICNRSVFYVFFIRGDTEETIKNIYNARVIRYPAVLLVRLFQKRIFRLMLEGRGAAYTYGSRLQDKYKLYGETLSIAPLISDDLVRHDSRVVDQTDIKKQFRVLYVGRLSSEKGVIELIEACALARECGEGFYLTIIGHGNLEQIISRLIETKELDRWISFVGYVPHGAELVEYYDQHDLLCLPSRTEGVPRVIVEAFARSLPVAATPVGSIPDLFSDNIFFIPKVDPKSIYETILHCRAQAKDRQRAATNGPGIARRYTVEYYSEVVDKKLRRLEG